MAPSRNSIRLLAEREETMKSGGGAGLGVCPPPVPASMAKTQDSSELDVDMMDDVILLAGMLRGNFLDVQADAATAVAGLTADREFCFFSLMVHARTHRFVPYVLLRTFLRVSPRFVPLLTRRQPCPVQLPEEVLGHPPSS